MSHHHFREFWIDPASNRPSASRLCFLVIILVYLPALTLMEALGVKLGIWSHMAVIVGSVSTVYGINSGVRVWRGRVIPDKEK